MTHPNARDIDELASLVEAARIEQLEAHIRRLTDALREYGQHKYDCPEVYFTVVPKLCNCGFARALTEMEGEDG